MAVLMSYELAAINKWRFSVKIQEERGLPDFAKLEVLAEQGVKKSDFFVVDGEFNYEDVKKQVTALSEALRSPRTIDVIYDISRFVLYTRIHSVSNYFNSIMTRVSSEIISAEGELDDYSGFGSASNN